MTTRRAPRSRSARTASATALAGRGVGQLYAGADGGGQQRRGDPQIALCTGVGGARGCQHHGITRPPAGFDQSIGHHLHHLRAAEGSRDRHIVVSTGRDMVGDVHQDVIATGQECRHQHRWGIVECPQHLVRCRARPHRRTPPDAAVEQSPRPAGQFADLRHLPVCACRAPPGAGSAVTARRPRRRRSPAGIPAVTVATMFLSPNAVRRRSTAVSTAWVSVPAPG